MLSHIRIIAWIGVIVLVGVQAVVLGSQYLTGQKPEQRSSAWSPGSGVAAIGGPFQLTTHQGKTFTEADVAGKPHLVFFGFTHCPDVCPTTLGELSVLMDELGPEADRFIPILITVDPERDTQQVLAEYMSSFDSRIVALTGTLQQTEAAVKAFKAYARKVPMDGGNYTMDHTAGVFLMKASGEFSGTLDMHESQEVRLQKLKRLIRDET